MPSTQLTLAVPPNAVDITLHYAHDYTGHGATFDYLHAIRQGTLFTLFANPKASEEQYWRDLDANRKTFVASVNGNFDLIVDSPSRSGYHRPYLSAFAAAFAGSPCLHLIKTVDLSSSPQNRQGLLAGINHRFPNAPALATHQRVLIVDDVFATGNMSSIVIEKLFGWGLPRHADIHVACPLRVVAAHFAQGSL